MKLPSLRPHPAWPGVLLLLAGCRSVDRRIDEAGAVLLVYFVLGSLLQLVLPALHGRAWFQRLRAALVPLAWLGSVLALLAGVLLSTAALDAKRLPVVRSGLAVVTLALGLWLGMWARAVTAGAQEKYAKLAAFTASVLIALLYLLTHGTRLF